MRLSERVRRSPVPGIRGLAAVEPDFELLQYVKVLLIIKLQRGKGVLKFLPAA